MTNMIAYINNTTSPVMLYVREKNGLAVSVEVKPGCFWECPLECEVTNIDVLVKLGKIKESRSFPIHPDIS